MDSFQIEQMDHRRVRVRKIMSGRAEGTYFLAENMKYEINK